MPIAVDPELARRWQEKQQRMTATAEAENAAPETTLFDLARAREICGRVAAGESLQAICANGNDKTELQRVMRWLFFDEIETFTADYVAARSARLELMLDEVVAIADELAEPAGNGDKDRLAIAKLRIDARKWLIDKQLKTDAVAPTSEHGRLIPSEILRDGVDN